MILRMKKIYIKDYIKLKGNTRKNIISSLGQGFHPESDENVLIYTINKSWFSPKGDTLYIEFDKDGKADTIYTKKNEAGSKYNS